MNQPRFEQKRVYIEVNGDMGVLFQNAQKLIEKRTGLRLNQHTLTRNAVIIGLSDIIQGSEPDVLKKTEN